MGKNFMFINIAKYAIYLPLIAKLFLKITSGRWLDYINAFLQTVLEDFLHVYCDYG